MCMTPNMHMHMHAAHVHAGGRGDARQNDPGGEGTLVLHFVNHCSSTEQYPLSDLISIESIRFSTSTVLRVHDHFAESLRIRR